MPKILPQNDDEFRARLFMSVISELRIRIPHFTFRRSVKEQQGEKQQIFKNLASLMAN